MASDARYSDPWNPHLATSAYLPLGPLAETAQNGRPYDPYGQAASPRANSYYSQHHRTTSTSVDDPGSSTESLSTTPPRAKAQGSYSALNTNANNTSRPSASLHGSRQHPFSSSFEPPNWKLIVIHVILTLLAFPTLLVFVLIARNKTLFWTRLLVSVGCGLVGFCLGLSLINLGKSFLEAATWATLIHQSQLDASSGIALRDFAALSDDSSSAWNALRLLWDRIMYPGTNHSRRKQYDPRWWTLYIVFFLFLVTTAAALTFILGRIVDIFTRVEHQHLEYTEVIVKGDLSTNDLAQADAIAPFFNSFALTWTLSGFSSEGSKATAISFPWGSDSVYFAEVTRSQIQPNGRGRGTFDTNSTRNAVDTTPFAPGATDASKPVEPGNIMRFPRWGIRIHCKRIPEPQRNIIPLSAAGRSYLFTPRDTVRDLYSSFNLSLPERLNSPLNMTDVLDTDSIPGGFDPQNSALGASFFENRIAHSFKSTPTSMGEDGNGFVSLEALLVRLDTKFTPNGVFPVTRNVSVDGQQVRMGYDGAICLELFEPWILESYNTTFGLPTSTRIVGKGNEIKDIAEQERNTGRRLDGIKRQLNSSQLRNAYTVAHDSSINQLVKDNGRDAGYAPNPTLTSFTPGSGPEGYTELSEVWFADARAKADASNILAYLVGTGDVVARSYSDLVLSSASLNYVYMGVFCGAVLVIGLLAGFCVPRLPLGVPKRGFELHSWVAAFYGDGVTDAIQKAGVEKNMDIREIERRFGNIKVHFAV